MESIKKASSSEEASCQNVSGACCRVSVVLPSPRNDNADERIRPLFNYQALVYVRASDNTRHALPQTRY